MSDTQLQARAIELTNEFTSELTQFCDARVPPLLSNDEYEAACSALLIALTRQLARAAAAFASANGQDHADVELMIVRMFNTNHAKAVAALGEGETVQ